jgi:hypothetical protein
MILSPKSDFWRWQIKTTITALLFKQLFVGKQHPVCKHQADCSFGCALEKENGIKDLSSDVHPLPKLVWNG